MPKIVVVLLGDLPAWPPGCFLAPHGRVHVHVWWRSGVATSCSTGSAARGQAAAPLFLLPSKPNSTKQVTKNLKQHVTGCRSAVQIISCVL